MRWGRYIVAGLVVLCTTFLVSTVWLYFANNEQQQRLHQSGRSAAWLNYQAQIELLRTVSMLRQCSTKPDCMVKQAAAQVSVMASRLRALIDLTRSTNPPSIPRYYYQLQHYYLLLADHSDTFATDTGEAAVARTFASVVRELEPLANLLQTALSAAVLQPSGPPADELFPPVDASLPFILLVASGAGLMAVLAHDLRQGGAMLREIRTLRDSERDLQTGTVELLEALPVPVLVMASDNSVRYANQAATELATSPRGSVGMDVLAATVRQNVGRLEAGQSVQRDFPVGNGDGSLRHLSVKANGIRLLGDSAEVYVIVDNTLLRDAELRAMTAGKLAILGELTSAIAHELNQPLAVIKAAAANGRNLALALQDGDRIAAKLTRIDEQIERARRIIDNVRKLGRPAQPHWTAFSVSRSLGSSLGLVSQQYRLSGIALEIDVEIGDDVSVFGDPTLFEIALLNVLLNAREAFARSGGRDREAAPVVRVRARAVVGGVTVTIADNAGGIPASILPRIFDSFVSSKSAEIGTGLGLSIARRAIEGMRGELGAENGVGGAVFSIHLPALAREAAA